MDSTRPTILFLTRYFTPSTAAAGLRADRFVRTLRPMNLRVLVVTHGPQPVLESPHPDLLVCRLDPDAPLPRQLARDHAPHWPRCRLLPGPSPDAHFARAAFHAAAALARRYPPRLILASAPPFSLLTVARQLAQTLNLPLVLDFRDAWFTGMPWPYPHALQRRLAQRHERLCLRAARLILTATDAHRRLLADAFGQAVAAKTAALRHGYQLPPDPPPPLPAACLPSPPDREKPFIIAHVGQLRGLDHQPPHPLIAPLHALRRALQRLLLGASFLENLRLDWLSPRYLLAAFAQLADSHPNFRRRARLLFVGQAFPDIDDFARRRRLTHAIIQLGPQAPDLAQTIAHHADLLVLMLYGITGCPYHHCVPSKTYSYLAAQKPILALLPPGEALDLATRAGLALPAPPDDPAAIARQILLAFSSPIPNSQPLIPNPDFISSFSWPSQFAALPPLLAPLLV